MKENGMKPNYTFVDQYVLIIVLYLDQDNHQDLLLNVLIALLHQETLNQDVHRMNQTL